MMKSLNESRDILQKFKPISKTYYTVAGIDDELNKLNERIMVELDNINYASNSPIPEIRDSYNNFITNFGLIVSSHHTLKINNDLYNQSDLEYLFKLIKETYEGLVSLIYFINEEKRRGS